MGLHGGNGGVLEVYGKNGKHEIVNLNSKTESRGLLGKPGDLVAFDSHKFKARSAEGSGKARIIEITEENF